MIDDNDLRAALVRFRENEIFKTWSNDPSSRKHCVLRRAMIDHLLRFKPDCVIAWFTEMPPHFLRNTEPSQISMYGPSIIDLVQRHCHRATALASLSAQHSRKAGSQPKE